jgi:prepilin-type N-terminal cleavage/methylation domain-containing protein
MRTVYQKDSGTCQGFTLVELAIVITIIGLLIGGILKGQEMVQNARATATIAQVKSYLAAMETFRDRYDQLPGDYSGATQRLPGCTAANFCVNGNGNNIIGLAVVSAADQNQTGSTAPQVETSMFWKHLALADLISGVNPAATPDAPAWGRTHPSVPLGGGFRAATKTTGSPDSFPGCHLLKLTGGPTDGVPIVTPGMAAAIDRKMDDGRPNAGFVAAESVGAGCKTNDGVTGVYNETDTRKICQMYFRL